MTINVDDLIDKIHERCGDTSYSQEESAEAYEEIASACDIAAEAIRAEMDDE